MRVLKALGRLLLALAIIASVTYGFYGLWTYVRPLHKQDLRTALESKVADRPEVFLEGACQAYDSGNYKVAKKVLELALEELIDKSGRYKPADAGRVEKVHFLLAKTLHRLEDFEKAIKEYEETLRINPDHYDAKYNLEMLKQSGGGGGGGEDQQQGKRKPRL